MGKIKKKKETNQEWGKDDKNNIQGVSTARSKEHERK